MCARYKLSAMGSRPYSCISGSTRSGLHVDVRLHMTHGGAHDVAPLAPVGGAEFARRSLDVDRAWLGLRVAQTSNSVPPPRF